MKYIESLREGERINEIYLCKVKQAAMTKAGKPYDNVILQDKTGTLDAKIWDPGSVGIDEFEALDYVAVTGDVTSFQGNLQLSIKRARKVQEGEYEPKDYLPCTEKDVDEMFTELMEYIDSVKNPYLNLATLLIVLILLSFYYESGMWTRIINIVTFMGIGMLFEPVALLLLHAMNFHMGESYKYYFVMVICSFVRGNVMYILSKLISKKGMQIADFPKEILGVLVMVFTFTVLNCCFVILLSLEAGSEKSLLMCASIVISIVLTDYFMLYMMERFNYLVQKQYEDAMYREEMHYKDIYYEEAEKQNKEVQKLKHDMKHKLHELYHLVENSDGQELSEKIGAMCMEFEQIDEKQYSDNPIVDSVLRIKFGRAKARGIKVETSIRIPKQMQLDHGDIGVLYGNLVDNAVEACSKVPEEQRFVKIENKYQSGILLLVITNSKTGKKNKSLKTTKKDNIRHGHGVQSVRKVVEKYNGTVSFTDKGDIFEVSAMLYGIEVKE